MKRSVIRDSCVGIARRFPDYAPLHPGYDSGATNYFSSNSSPNSSLTFCFASFSAAAPSRVIR